MPGSGLGGPTPGPNRWRTCSSPASRPGPPRAPRPEISKARRSFLIGAAIGLLLLGVTMAAMVARRGGHPSGAPPSPPAQQH